MMTKQQVEGIAQRVQGIGPEHWAGIREWVEERIREANENTTAEGEPRREWWAGHERFGRDVLQELEDLRTGAWRAWAELAALEEPEPAAVELRERKGRRKDEDAVDTEET